MLQAKFHVVGVVQERRELKSQKNPNWRGYVLKVASLGVLVELTVSAEQFAAIGQGELMEFVGRIEQAGNRQQLVLAQAKPVGQAKAGAA